MKSKIIIWIFLIGLITFIGVMFIFKYVFAQSIMISVSNENSDVLGSFKSEEVRILNISQSQPIQNEIFNESYYYQKDTIFFDQTKLNTIKITKEEPISTFSSDADDGSYRLFVSQIKSGQLINKNAVRIEEFINFYPYKYNIPTTLETPFTTDIKIAKSPWSENYLLKIGIKGYEYTLENLPNVNLVFLLDNSISMSNELPIIKKSLNTLVDKLRSDDRIAIVTYASNATTLLSSTSCSEKEIIKSFINGLTYEESTNGSSGINLAYQEINKGFIKNGINKILLVSDGDFNLGIQSVDELKELIQEKRKLGITFSTIGFNFNGNYGDEFMKVLANNGNGNYTFVSNTNDSQRVFDKKFISTLKNIAKDVKYQLEFNPEIIKEYRLIGYENKILNKENFNNDNIDAGEIPSGLTTTAIYEITFKDKESYLSEYRHLKNKNDLLNSNELAYLKIRFKNPNENKSKLLSYSITKDFVKDDMDDDFKIASSIAGFAQLYKGSSYISKDYDYDVILNNLDMIKNYNIEIEEFKEIVNFTKSILKSQITDDEINNDPYYNNKLVVY